MALALDWQSLVNYIIIILIENPSIRRYDHLGLDMGKTFLGDHRKWFYRQAQYNVTCSYQTMGRGVNVVGGGMQL